MYLSRLFLNTRDRRVRRDIADCQQMHRTLLSIWPQLDGPEGARAQAALLYRLESEPRTGAAAILVQSGDAPDWSRLPDGYLLGHETKAVDSAYAGLRQGMHERFRLRANPTRKIETKSGPDGEHRNGKRVDLRREEDQIAWLERKGLEQCGFRLAGVETHPDVPNLLMRGEDRTRGSRGGKRLTFGSVLFEGELIITDAVLFRNGLQNGVGPGKAYGFGLLSVAKAGG